MRTAVRIAAVHPYHHDLVTASPTAVPLLSDTVLDVPAPGHGPQRLRVPTGRRLSIG